MNPHLLSPPSPPRALHQTPAFFHAPSSPKYDERTSFYNVTPGVHVCVFLLLIFYGQFCVFVCSASCYYRATFTNAIRGCFVKCELKERSPNMISVLLLPLIYNAQMLPHKKAAHLHLLWRRAITYTYSHARTCPATTYPGTMPNSLKDMKSLCTCTHTATTLQAYPLRVPQERSKRGACMT